MKKGQVKKARRKRHTVPGYWQRRGRKRVYVRKHRRRNRKKGRRRSRIFRR